MISVRGPISHRICFLEHRYFFVFYFFPLRGGQAKGGKLHYFYEPFPNTECPIKILLISYGSPRWISHQNGTRPIFWDETETEKSDMWKFRTRPRKRGCWFVARDKTVSFFLSETRFNLKFWARPRVSVSLFMRPRQELTFKWEKDFIFGLILLKLLIQIRMRPRWDWVKLK